MIPVYLWLKTSKNQQFPMVAALISLRVLDFFLLLLGRCQPSPGVPCIPGGAAGGASNIEIFPGE